MIQVFLYHIDLTLKVAMVTENDRQYMIKSYKVSLWTKLWRFSVRFVFNKISAQLNTKTIFKEGPLLTIVSFQLPVCYVVEQLLNNCIYFNNFSYMNTY